MIATQYAINKKKWNLIHNCPAVKSVWPQEGYIVKKYVKNPRWQPRNGYDGWLMVKLL